MLPILLMQPGSAGKRRTFSEITRLGPRHALPPSRDSIKERLREIRNDSLEQLDSLVDQMHSAVAGESRVQVRLASDVGDALEAIREISQGTKIAISKSAVVANELLPGLVESGSQVIETYYDQFNDFENRFEHPWMLPKMEFGALFESFGPAVEQGPLRQIRLRQAGSKKVTGLLGVNAVSAEDGSILLLQHTQNIRSILEQATNLIFVAGLDKIVRNVADASFLTNCMGAFGCEVLPLSVQAKASQGETIESLSFNAPPVQNSGNVHLIVFDNGRSGLRKGRYKDLMTCIGCRACVKACPAYPFFHGESRWTPKEYIFFFATGNNPSLELCLQCKSCRIHCPLDIDLPGMILDARIEAAAKRHRPFAESLFSHIDTMAGLGSAMPWATEVAARNKILRWLGEKMLNISKDRKIPMAQRETFARWIRSSRDKDIRGR